MNLFYILKGFLKYLLREQHNKQKFANDISFIKIKKILIHEIEMSESIFKKKYKVKKLFSSLALCL